MSIDKDRPAQWRSGSGKYPAAHECDEIDALLDEIDKLRMEGNVQAVINRILVGERMKIMAILKPKGEE